MKANWIDTPIPSTCRRYRHQISRRFLIAIGQGLRQEKLDQCEHVVVDEDEERAWGGSVSFGQRRSP